MRTRLEIDDDVLLAAKELAARERKSVGRMLSELARRGIQAARCHRRGTRLVNGFEVLPAGDRVVTTELVMRFLGESQDA